MRLELRITPIISLVATLLLAQPLAAQRVQLLKFDYTKADSHAINYPRSSAKTAHEFAKELTSRFDTEHEKYRVIYRWVTNNIQYRKGRALDNADDVYKKKKSEGLGFALLIESMCHAVGIKCETIEGFLKTNPYDHIPMKMKDPNHGWNAVFLAGEWHLSDALLGAGIIEPRRKKFFKQFRNEWFLPDANFFIQSHYPIDERWMLHDMPFKEKTFKKGPVSTIYAYERGISIVSKTKGVLNKRLKITMNSDTMIDYASIVFAGDEDEPYNVLLRKRGDTYIIDYKLDKTQDGMCTLRLNGEACFLFLKR